MRLPTDLYKIIYRVDNIYLRIVSVFNARQNPDKITGFQDR